MLEAYFDGDASRLATLLDPTRMGSPLHQFRAEVAAGFKALEEKLVALEAAQAARAGERSKSAAKGGDFEDLLEGLLGEIARGANDLLERTGTDAGRRRPVQEGRLRPDAGPRPHARGGAPGGRRGQGPEDLRPRDARRAARSAGRTATRPSGWSSSRRRTRRPGIAPFDVRAGDVYCVIDPADPDRATLEAAVRLARLLALASLREREAEVDAAAIGEALTGIREQLEASPGAEGPAHLDRHTAGAGGLDGLDRLRDGIVAQIVPGRSGSSAVAPPAGRRTAALGPAGPGCERVVSSRPDSAGQRSRVHEDLPWRARCGRGPSSSASSRSR